MTPASRASSILVLLMTCVMASGQRAGDAKLTQQVEVGIAAYARGDLAKARVAFEAALDRGPSIGPLYVDVSLCLALVDLRSGKLEEALRRLRSRVLPIGGQLPREALGHA
jgi:hypothetical protein